MAGFFLVCSIYTCCDVLDSFCKVAEIEGV